MKRQPGAMIIAATIAILLGLWMDRPPPVQNIQVDYCWIDYYTGHNEWGEGYGPCSDQDIYRDI